MIPTTTPDSLTFGKGFPGTAVPDIETKPQTANEEIKAEVEYAVDHFWGDFLGYGEKDKSSFGQQWILLRVMVKAAVVAGYKIGLRNGKKEVKGWKMTLLRD